MTTNNNSFCLWNPTGNGYYTTGCGNLVYDYGRLRKIEIEVYGDSRPPLKIFETCPKCKKNVKVE